MSNNLFDSGHDLKNKINDWAKGVISDIKSAFGINSPSTVMRDEVGKYLALGVASGLTQNSKLVVKAFSAMLEKLDYQRKFDIISEDDYYYQLEKLRDKYFSEGTQNWVKYTEKIYAYQKKAVEDEKKLISDLYSDISDFAEERLDEVIKKQQSLASSLDGIGKLYNENVAKINGASYEYYSMHDFNTDIERINLYCELLEKVQKRCDELNISADVSKGFMASLKEIGINEATGLSIALMGATDTKFSEYFDAWDRKRELVGNVSAKWYEDDFRDACDEVYTSMTDALSKAGYEIPQGFFTSGSISAQKFGEAFLCELDEQMQKIRDKIELFNAELSASVNLDLQGSGNVFNTNNTSYNITTPKTYDAVEQIRRYETIKRLSGVQ